MNLAKYWFFTVTDRMRVLWTLVLFHWLPLAHLLAQSAPVLAWSFFRSLIPQSVCHLEPTELVFFNISFSVPKLECPYTPLPPHSAVPFKRLHIIWWHDIYTTYSFDSFAIKFGRACDNITSCAFLGQFLRLRLPGHGTDLHKCGLSILVNFILD